MVKEKKVSRPEKYVELPLVLFQELTAKVDGEQLEEAWKSARIFTKNITHTEIARDSEEGEEGPRKSAPGGYEPGKGLHREGGSLGRFG